MAPEINLVRFLDMHFFSLEFHPRVPVKSVNFLMKFKEGQFVFLKSGASFEVVTFVRFSEASKTRQNVAVNSLRPEQQHAKPGPAAVIKRRGRPHEELVMINEIHPIPSQATSIRS